MNIKTLKKISEGRKLFPELKIKKKGYNKFNKFKYYELDDLLSADNFLCEQLNLFTRLNQENPEIVKLEIYDLDQDDKQTPVTFHIPVCEVNNSNITQGQQEHGSIQKYAWRYLLLQTWNISEADSIDSSEIGLTSKIKVSPERIHELAEQLGNKVYADGGDATNKETLKKYLDDEYKNKKVTSQEYEELLNMINKQR